MYCKVFFCENYSGLSSDWFLIIKQINNIAIFVPKTIQVVKQAKTEKYYTWCSFKNYRI